MSKTSSAVKAKYNAKAYDRLNIAVPKGRRQDLEDYVETTGKRSINRLVNDLLRGELGMSGEEWGYKEDV